MKSVTERACVCLCCNMLHSLAEPGLFLQFQIVQYASDLQKLLSFPLRPASSAQRLFPVVEEQHDSLPVLCVKKHQVCAAPPPKSQFLLYLTQAHNQLAADVFASQNVFFPSSFLMH